MEAHISGMRDGAHGGHLGAHFRDQLGIEEAEEVDVEVEKETAGIPVPVNSWLIVVGAVGVFLLVVSSGGSEEDEEELADEVAGDEAVVSRGERGPFAREMEVSA